MYWSFATLLQIGLTISMVNNSVESAPQNVAWLVGTVLYGLLAFAVAFLMIFKTESLARIVGLATDSNTTQLPSLDVLLKTGILLIGIYFLMGTIPVIIRQISDAFHYKEIMPRFNWISKTISSLFQVAMAVYLRMNPDKVIRLITENKNDTEQGRPD